MRINPIQFQVSCRDNFAMCFFLGQRSNVVFFPPPVPDFHFPKALAPGLQARFFFRPVGSRFWFIEVHRFLRQALAKLAFTQCKSSKAHGFNLCLVGWGWLVMSGSQDSAHPAKNVTHKSSRGSGGTASTLAPPWACTTAPPEPWPRRCLVVGVTQKAGLFTLAQNRFG